MAPKKQVLIVEDDPDMIELLRLILMRGGYSPISALGGQEGLNQLQKTRVDLVLLDLMMDDMSGWEVLRAIKAEDSTKAIPVLIVTAKHRMETAQQATEHAGMFEGYLVKPFIVGDLLTEIKEALG